MKEIPKTNKSYHRFIDVMAIHDLCVYAFEGKEGLIKLGKRKRDNEKVPPHRSLKKRMDELSIKDCNVIHAMLICSMEYIDFKNTHL